MRDFHNAASKKEVNKLKEKLKEINVLVWTSLIFNFGLCIYLILIQ